MRSFLDPFWTRKRKVHEKYARVHEKYARVHNLFHNSNFVRISPFLDS